MKALVENIVKEASTRTNDRWIRENILLILRCLSIRCVNKYKINIEIFMYIILSIFSIAMIHASLLNSHFNIDLLIKLTVLTIVIDVINYSRRNRLFCKYEVK